jgi:hypothetical protein
VISALTDQLAAETALVAQLSPDHCGALERIEAESLVPYRHQSLRGSATGGSHRDNQTDPTTLQAVPSENLTRLQTLARVPTASGNLDGQQRRANGPPEKLPRSL